MNIFLADDFGTFYEFLVVIGACCVRKLSVVLAFVESQSQSSRISDIVGCNCKKNGRRPKMPAKIS
jgi:hypothetical protein